MIKKIFKKIRRLLLELFHLFYLPRLILFYSKKIDCLPKETQLFLLTRMDFGTFLYLIYYVHLWQEQRGKTALVILTPQFETVRQLAALLSPKTVVINPDSTTLRLAIGFFGEHVIHEETFFRCYGYLFAKYPAALRIFDPSPRACYHRFFDARLTHIPPNISSGFLQAYGEIRKVLNYDEKILLDGFSLHFKAGLKRRVFCSNALDELKRIFRIESPFVVINLNKKIYKENGTYRKTVQHPERYNVIIDYLTEKGFTVVIQGREEQHPFQKRKNLIDYARSSEVSVENDIALFSGAFFSIVNKTGPESFNTICNTPQLGLNYSELCCITPHVKLRFFPKHVWKKGERLSWEQMLYAPSFFDLARYNFDPDVTYEELSEEELLAAVQEFLPLANSPDENWTNYSTNQQIFKNKLVSLHLDLFEAKSVPCETYLENEV